MATFATSFFMYLYHMPKVQPHHSSFQRHVKGHLQMSRHQGDNQLHKHWVYHEPVYLHFDLHTHCSYSGVQQNFWCSSHLVMMEVVQNTRLWHFLLRMGTDSWAKPTWLGSPEDSSYSGHYWCHMMANKRFSRNIVAHNVFITLCIEEF